MGIGLLGYPDFFQVCVRYPKSLHDWSRFLTQSNGYLITRVDADRECFLNSYWFIFQYMFENQVQTKFN